MAMLMLLGFLVQIPSLIVREPRPAAPWTETFRARCGNDELEIVRQMRTARGTADGLPSVRVNGRPARGEVGALLTELRDVRAAYRFSFLCPQIGGGIQLRWVRGVFGRDGIISYRSGGAMVRHGVVAGVVAEPSNEDSFWYS